MVNFLQHFANGFCQLFDRCVSLAIAGKDPYAMGRPTLLHYIENIEKIDVTNQASFYQARLQALDQHLENLNSVRHADISTIVDIEVARACSEQDLLR